MNGNPKKTIKKFKTGSAAFGKSDTVPDIVITAPGRKFSIAREAKFKLVFKGPEGPGEPASKLEWKASKQGNDFVVDIEMRDVALSAYEFDIVTVSGTEDPIIIIDPDLNSN